MLSLSYSSASQRSPRWRSRRNDGFIILKIEPGNGFVASPEIDSLWRTNASASAHPPRRDQLRRCRHDVQSSQRALELGPPSTVAEGCGGDLLKRNTSFQKQMTVLQVTCQPFGILNALRERFAIPFGVTALLRFVLFAPKDTFVYQTLGASGSHDPVKSSRSRKRPI
jgi:hypothetical protein